MSKKLNLRWTVMQFLSVYFLIIAMGFLTGCADVISVESSEVVKHYGFFNGLWHGLVAPLSIWGSLFWPKSIAFYALVNTGWWYNFGFIWGIAAVAGGSSRTIK